MATGKPAKTQKRRKSIRIYRNNEAKNMRMKVQRDVRVDVGGNHVLVSSRKNDDIMIGDDLLIDKLLLGGSSSFNYKFIKNRLLYNKGTGDLLRSMKENRGGYKKLFFYSLYAYIQKKNLLNHEKECSGFFVDNLRYTIELDRSFLFLKYGDCPNIELKTTPLMCNEILKTLSVYIDDRQICDNKINTSSIRVCIRDYPVYPTELRHVRVVVCGQVVLQSHIYLIKIDRGLVEQLLNFSPQVSKQNGQVNIDDIKYEHNDMNNPMYTQRVRMLLGKNDIDVQNIMSDHIHYLLSSIIHNPVFLMFLITLDLANILISTIMFKWVSKIITDLLLFISEYLSCKHVVLGFGS